MLGPLRRYILYLLSSVTIKDWEVTINIEDGGDGEVIYDFSGKVRFGLNKWVHIGIRSDEPQPCGSEFPTEVTNMLNNRRTDPIFVIDEPTYKRLRIAFGQTLVTGNRFHFRVRFRLLGTFYLGQTDYYTQQAIHHQRKIVINVNFPPTVSVQEVDQRILTEHGDDTWVDKPAEILDPQRVRWEIGKVGFGNSHTLEWRTTRL